jgi:hypothetical protein
MMVNKGNSISKKRIRVSSKPLNNGLSPTKLPATYAVVSLLRDAYKFDVLLRIKG